MDERSSFVLSQYVHVFEGGGTDSVATLYGSMEGERRFWREKEQLCVMVLTCSHFWRICGVHLHC